MPCSVSYKSAWTHGHQSAKILSHFYAFKLITYSCFKNKSMCYLPEMKLKYVTTTKPLSFLANKLYKFHFGWARKKQRYFLKALWIYLWLNRRIPNTDILHVYSGCTCMWLISIERSLNLNKKSFWDKAFRVANQFICHFCMNMSINHDISTPFIKAMMVTSGVKSIFR